MQATLRVLLWPPSAGFLHSLGVCLLQFFVYRVQHEAAAALAALRSAGPEQALRRDLRLETLGRANSAAEASARESGGGAPCAAERRLLAGAWLPEELWAAVLAERPSALWCVQPCMKNLLLLLFGARVLAPMTIAADLP